MHDLVSLSCSFAFELTVSHARSVVRSLHRHTDFNVSSIPLIQREIWQRTIAKKTGWHMANIMREVLPMRPSPIRAVTVA